jgi:hypothetical protein
MRRALLCARSGPDASCYSRAAVRLATAPAPTTTTTPPAFLLRDDSGIDFVHRRFMTPGKKYLNR